MVVRARVCADNPDGISVLVQGALLESNHRLLLALRVDLGNSEAIAHALLVQPTR